jgi:energy-coupling factor transporter ATP-binding protein EcfA2
VAGSRRQPKRQRTRFVLNAKSLPEQGELQVITNAIHAALEYSPLTVAPRHDDDVYAHVARQIEERFWSDIYVERPEIREILFTLETGQLVLITGERGTGKSTAVQAVVHEHSKAIDEQRDLASPLRKSNIIIPYVFDANAFTEDLGDVVSAATTIQRDMYEFLDRRIEDRVAWLGYLYQHHLAFERFRLTVDKDDLRSGAAEDWKFLADQPEYTSLIDDGIAKFSDTPYSDRLRTLLKFIGESTNFEPLLIIDNVDHLNNDVVDRCGIVLAAVLQSSPHRIRAAIAVRPENADALQSAIDTAVKPNRISMMQRPLTPNRYVKPPIDVTLSFLEKRIAVLREPEMIEVILKAIDKEKASRLAEKLTKDDVARFLDSVIELLDVMIYDVFRTDEDDESLRSENWEFARAVHSWHNGSLRECGLSLTTFASDILQDKTHMYQLRDLLRSVVESREEQPIARRMQLRRVTRSLLYRHLLFWAAPDGETTRPLKNVMVFDGNEESTDPPIHFLRLRILQFLAHRQHNRATVTNIRHEFGKLEVEERRIDEALRELAVKRTQDDVGLIRIDGLTDINDGDRLLESATVQLLDAGRFLVDTLYITTEYLFWSAVNSPAFVPPELPKNVTSEDIQSDAFRTMIATSFLEHYLVVKFCDEHPYLRGPNEEWTTRRVRQRLMLYKTMFGFERENWFLDRVTRSVSAFIPPRDPTQKFAAALAALERIRALARSLDRMMLPAA